MLLSENLKASSSATPTRLAELAFLHFLSEGCFPPVDLRPSA